MIQISGGGARSLDRREQLRHLPDRRVGWRNATGVSPSASIRSAGVRSFFSHEPFGSDSRSRCRGWRDTAHSRPSRLDATRVLAEIAAHHGVTAAQVVLRWHVEHDVVVIPKSVHRDRIEANFAIDTFSLEPEEVSRIDALSTVM